VSVLDPIPLVAWLAGVTSRIGLAVTFSVSRHHPDDAARLFATLDHLTRGRIGWNVVTTPNRHETVRGHDEVPARRSLRSGRRVPRGVREALA
jgi:alkanesulfonate monooxygenase SsuD/methylene tetrahydromethanopterin reductase-like flavin-dependent oxidoreductase (luciferase family)